MTKHDINGYMETVQDAHDAAALADAGMNGEEWNELSTARTSPRFVHFRQLAVDVEAGR